VQQVLRTLWDMVDQFMEKANRIGVDLMVEKAMGHGLEEEKEEHLEENEGLLREKQALFYEKEALKQLNESLEEEKDAL
jgi:hypothetical protein